MKWDYLWTKLETSELGKDWQDEIKDRGEEGWELVSVQLNEGEFYFFFKKVIEEEKRKITPQIW